MGEAMSLPPPKPQGFPDPCTATPCTPEAVAIGSINLLSLSHSDRLYSCPIDFIPYYHRCLKTVANVAHKDVYCILHYPGISRYIGIHDIINGIWIEQ